MLKLTFYIFKELTMALNIPLLSKDFGVFIPKLNKSLPIDFGDLKINLEKNGRVKIKLGKMVTTIKTTADSLVYSVLKTNNFVKILPKQKPKNYSQELYKVENTLWELGFCNQSGYPYGMQVKGNIYTAIREIESQYPTILKNYRDNYNKYEVIEGDGYKIVLYHHDGVSKPMPLFFKIDRTPEVYNSIDIKKLVEELTLEMSKPF
jgi:hypothetical protein